MTEKIKLSEDTSKDIIESWREEARKMTLENLPTFLNKLMDDYIHDYGTICHAISIGSIATMWAMNNHENGGITGFQAGCITMQNIRNWNTEYKNVPLSLVTYDKMLYPQYAYEFDKTINENIWEWLQDEAQKNIDKGAANVHPDVFAHWQSIISGNIPFDYKLKKD